MVSGPFLPGKRIFLRQRVINVSAEANSVLIKTLSSMFFSGRQIEKCCCPRSGCFICEAKQEYPKGSVDFIAQGL